MIRNYFKVAIRNLWRNKVFSLINIFGLALGIATCLIIMLYVQNELSYDKYNKDADRIARVTFWGTMESGNIREASVMAPVGPTMKTDYPEVAEATRMRPYGTQKLKYAGKEFKEEGFRFVDSNFFRVFTLHVTEGNEATALLQPNSMVLTKSTAKRYFGNEAALGKVMAIDGSDDLLTVTGVIEDIPRNSHFHANVFVSMSTLADARVADWMSSNYLTYIKIGKGEKLNKLEAKLPQMVDKYMGPQMKKAMGLTLAEFRQKGNNIGFHLEPVTDIHLRSETTNDLEARGDIRYVYIFSIVALFMLLIACVNFMNLSTASASKRAREVGIRKVMGSLKKQLVSQFLTESILLTIFSLVIAVILVIMLLPAFNHFSGQELRLNFIENPWLFPILLFFGLLTGVFAGSYPAFFLSAFNPIRVLKGRFSATKESIGLRSGLVVFQFFISISLIVGTIIVYSQLSYIQNKKMGYDKEHVMVIENSYQLGTNQQAFPQQLLRNPAIQSITASGYLPAGESYNNNYFAYADDQPQQMVKSLRYDVDENYISTLGMQIVKGRNFSSAYGGDSSSMVINETAAIAFGWKDDPLGHTITYQNNGKITRYQVIGVVKDFHFRTLHETITPLVMTLGSDYARLIARVNTKDIPALIGSVREQWNTMVPGEPFSYSFLDERVMNSYIAEFNVGKILAIFAAITIFVACLGLFGLAAFTANQRIREIGIRKILGADVRGIVMMLSAQFMKLVAIAFGISIPVAWIVMSKWLQDFAYRVNISWWMFLLAAVVVTLLTIITVSFQAFKAALANPVKSLRSE